MNLGDWIHTTSEFVIIICSHNCSGTFNEFMEGQNISACIDCTAGYYCPTEGTAGTLFVKYKVESLKFSKRLTLEQTHCRYL